MCLICVDFQRERMTLRDAERAFQEMRSTLEPEHQREVREMIEKARREERQATKEPDP